jgi:uncharacterized protein YqgC (DUF456 family)
MVYIVWAIALLCVLLGVMGTVFPALPGTPLIFAGALLIGWWYDYSVLSGWVLSFLGFLAILGFGVDFLASSMGAKRVGASPRALLGATLGSFVGIFFALPGIIIGPFLGAFAGELLAQSSLQHATKVGIGTWIGLIVGTVAKVAIALSMVALIVTSLVF